LLKSRTAVSGCLVAALALGVAACGDDNGGGGSKGGSVSGTTLTVYASVPLQGASGGQGKAIENGAGLALDQVGGKVGKYTIKYERLDDSLASTGAADEGKAAQNARQAVSNKDTIGYIGEYNSGISKVTIPILNRAGIAQVSPSNTFVGLTTDAPGAEPGEPGKYYPTGRRTYARVLPNDVIQAGALVAATRGDGCKSIHLFNSGSLYSRGNAKNFKRAAAKAGLKVKASVRYPPTRPKTYKRLAKKVTAPCVVQMGEVERNAGQLLKAVASKRPHARLYGADAECLNPSSDPSRGVPRQLAGHYHCTIAALAPDAFGAAGRRFFADYSDRYHDKTPDPYAIYGYESMALTLASIDRASEAGGGLTRGRVVKALFATRTRHSVIGTYGIDPHGDTTLLDYGLYKLGKKRLSFGRKVVAVRP
jgi:branched-chain amino acid transport system substrate-binding protein